MNRVPRGHLLAWRLAGTPHERAGGHSWGRVAAALAIVCALCLPALGQPKPKPKQPDPKAGKPVPAATKTKPKEQNFNFDGLGITGKNRSPQLLYFLERANEELERASLEKRSFIPRMVKTVEDETL